MILSMSNQALLFFSTVLMGALIGFVYDWFRVIRGLFKHPNFLIHIEDVLFWIAVSIGIFVFMLNKNYGEIRMFSVCGIFIGMILYYFTISALFLSVSHMIIDFVTKVVIMVARIVMTPIRLILKITSYPYNASKKFALKQYRDQKKLLKKYHLYAKMKGKRMRKDMKIIFKKI